MTIADLKSIRAMRIDLENCQERIARLRSAMETLSRKIKSSTSRSTAEHDILGAQMGRILDLEAKLIAKIFAYEEALDSFEAFIAEFPPAQRLVLTLRYVQGNTWKEIAAISEYSEDHCIRIHRYALEKMSDNVG